MRARLSGRVIALTLVAVIASVVCVLLGAWQWGRASDILEAERAAASAPIPLADALVDGEIPGTSIGRTVIAEGAYDSADQLIVAQRALGAFPIRLGFAVAGTVIDIAQLFRRRAALALGANERGSHRFSAMLGEELLDELFLVRVRRRADRGVGEEAGVVLAGDHGPDAIRHQGRDAGMRP